MPDPDSSTYCFPQFRGGMERAFDATNVCPLLAAQGWEGTRLTENWVHKGTLETVALRREGIAMG